MSCLSSEQNESHSNFQCQMVRLLSCSCFILYKKHTCMMMTTQVDLIKGVYISVNINKWHYNVLEESVGQQPKHTREKLNNLKWADMGSVEYNPRLFPYAWFLICYIMYYLLYHNFYFRFCTVCFYFRSGTGGNASVSSVLLSSEELERYFPDKRLKIWVGCWNMGELKVRL